MGPVERLAAKVLGFAASLLLSFGAGWWTASAIAEGEATALELGVLVESARVNDEVAGDLAAVGAVTAAAVRVSHAGEAERVNQYQEALSHETDFAAMRRPASLQRLRTEDRAAVAAAVLSGRDDGTGRAAGERAAKPDARPK